MAMCKIYRGNPKDKIDTVLESYINNFPEREKIKIMFLRESEGVYHFGSRRIYIKIEQGDRILVRIGGGFMHIDQFIEKYTALELEKKMQSNDVIAKFQNKISIQKIADGALEKRELSPIRLPRRA